MAKSIVLLFFLAFFFVSCNNCNPSYTYSQPENTNDDLPVGTLASAHIDTAMIATAINKIRCGSFGEVHAMLIYKNNALVLEEYFPGHQYKWDAPGYHGELVSWGRDKVHEMMSVTKSFTSACIAIAIDKGFIKSVDQSIFDYLPDYQHLNVDNRKYIKIEHLITMTSGLAWDEWSAAHGTSSNDIDRLWFDCEKTIECVLERPWWKEPGELFTYNGGGMAILSEILKNASGLNIDEFSKKYLFEPLDIENTHWSQFPGGVWDGSGAFYITPRAMLKFGVTYLNNGVYNNQRIIPAAWVEKSSKPYNNNVGINIPGEDSGKNGYGYTWWTSEFSHKKGNINMFRAGGWGGQEIMVFPELGMVVVFTGGNYAKKTKLYTLLKKYVVLAIN